MKRRNYVILMATVVFLPLTMLMAEDEWEVTGQYSMSDQTGDLYYGWDGHMYKEIDITEWNCDREFYEDGSGFQMVGEWEIYVEAEVGSTLEEYSNTIELTGQAYHFCEQDWEWSGPPASAPSVDVDYECEAAGEQESRGNIYLTTGTPYLTSDGSATGAAYSWVHDSQNSDWVWVDAEVWGSVSNSSNSADRYWDNSKSDPEPNGTETSDEDEYDATYSYWTFSHDDTYEVESGIGAFSANGGVDGRCDADVHCDVESDQNGSALSINYSYIFGYSNIEMTN